MGINTNAWNRIRYTAFAPLYDHIARFRSQRRRAITLLGLQPGERVLISGAGTGADLDFLPAHADVVAVDITPAMVERTRARARSLGRGVDARIGDAQALEFPGGSFDAVVLHLIVAVAPDGRRVLEEAARVLRVGGRAVVFDKFVPDEKRPSPVRRIANLMTSALFSDVTRRLGPMLKGTGFEVVLREPAALGGTFEIVLLERRGAPIAHDWAGGEQTRRTSEEVNQG